MILNNVNFQKSQFFKTKLNKIDFTTCNISGITVDINDLKGMIVNEYQALELSNLLGIIIR